MVGQPTPGDSRNHWNQDDRLQRNRDPQANRDYAAIISVKVPDVNGQSATAQLSVIDTVTGAVVGTENSPSADRGYVTVVIFTPTTTNPVKLRVDIAAAGGQTFIADLDFASLVPSGDVGIAASPDWWTLGSQLWTSPVPSNAVHVQSFTVENGSVASGQASTYIGLAALFLEDMTGTFTVNNVTCTVNDGNQDSPIDGYWASGRTNITNNTIHRQCSAMPDRMHTGCHSVDSLPSARSTLEE